MLILTRKLGEKIAIGDNIAVTVLEIRGTQVKLGIEAPENIEIHRQEIFEKIREENLKSSDVSDQDLLRAAAVYESLALKEKKIED